LFAKTKLSDRTQRLPKGVFFIEGGPHLGEYGEFVMPAQAGIQWECANAAGTVKRKVRGDSCYRGNLHITSNCGNDIKSGWVHYALLIVLPFNATSRIRFDIRFSGN
jgi:hypothetical protein